MAGLKGDTADIASMSIPGALSALRVDAAAGLSPAEVDARCKEYGFNEVLERKERPVLQFLKKFWSPPAWMMEAIMIISAALGKYSDLIAVGVLLFVNAVVSFYQEHRAAGAVEAMRERLPVHARVLRSGEWRTLPARELVPGDIVRVRTGDLVPADLKLLTGSAGVDQSVLSGESGVDDRAPGGMLPSGSVVRRGEGNAVVISTGARTLFGRTMELVQLARPKLRIEAVVAKVVRALFFAVGSLLAGVMALSIYRGIPFSEMGPLMLVLLMSALPVALPVMFTVSSALGAREMARHGVLVTRLSAAEAAATMDVLCVDKTGTITENRMTVTGVIPLEGARETDILFAAALASRKANQDPIDMAFLAAAADRHVFDDQPPVTPVSFIPFDADKRRTEAVIEQSGRRLRVMKGAVPTLAGLTGQCPATCDALSARVRESARKGYRMLAVAWGPEPGPLELIGLVTLSDPPRPDARQLIAELRGLGVSVKMLTGDSLAVAGDIGRRIGLSRIRNTAGLQNAAAPVDRLEKIDGFAEVYPEDKYVLVRRLQDAGHVTGMTGDGVNDAPALRQADVGIAVSDATDAAKRASSVVLTEPGLSNIVTLIEQGRAVFQRMLSWIINKTSRTVFKSGYVILAFVFTGKFVVSAFAMLLLVLITDMAKISLATDRVRTSPKPETWNIGGFIRMSVVLGAAMIAEALLFLAVAWRPFGLAGNDPALHTFSFLLLLYFAAFSIVSVRERRRFWMSRPGGLLLASLAVEVILGAILARLGFSGLAPLPLTQISAILGYAMFCCLGLNDGLKAAMIKRLPCGLPEN